MKDNRPRICVPLFRILSRGSGREVIKPWKALLPLTAAAAAAMLLLALTLVVTALAAAAVALATATAGVTSSAAAIGLAAAASATPIAAAAVALVTLIAAAAAASSAAAVAATTTLRIVVSTAATKATSTSTVTTAVVGGSFVHSNCSSIEFDIIHCGDGSVGFRVLGETNESEPTTTASISIFDDNSFFNLAKLLELGPKGRIICVPC